MVLLKPLTAATRKVSTIVRALLPWFSGHARDLPWRRMPHCRNPYAVHVSEIMLQQTQVKTVIPYWQRWMEALPDVATLAGARPDRVLKLWEGLGYYSRARNLQRAAQAIMADHGGRFPEAYDDILALPGIGRYTAGAISSIAFHSPRPIVDGNVIRVLTRLFGIDGDPRQRAVNDELWQLAEALVTTAGPDRCSALNQSLMELGALVCTPRQAQCEACPLRHLCVAHQTDRVGELPALPRRPRPTAQRFVAFVLEDEGRYLVRQRPAGAVNARLWEFPNVEARHGESPLDACRRLLGRPAASLRPLLTVKHSITCYRITLESYRVTLPPGGEPGPAGRWRSAAQLARLAFTSAHRRVLRRLAGAGR
jgi:A/G-specific adenine glycosylase